MTYLLCTQCAIPAVTPMATPMARQRKSAPPYGYLAVLELAAIARNSHAHEADTDAASSVTISNDASIPSSTENRILTGTVKANKLVGGDGDDEISGDPGYDRLLGEDDHDWLFGGDGKDMLFGNYGNDWLYVQAGDDILKGGAGYDFFRVTVGGDSNNGHDTITDFDVTATTGDIVRTSWQGGGATPSDLRAAGLALGTNTDGDAVLTDSTDTSIFYLTFEGIAQADLVEATHFDFV